MTYVEFGPSCQLKGLVKFGVEVQYLDGQRWLLAWQFGAQELANPERRLDQLVYMLQKWLATVLGGSPPGVSMCCPLKD